MSVRRKVFIWLSLSVIGWVVVAGIAVLVRALAGVGL